MAKTTVVSVYWSYKALTNSLSIKEYLQRKFTQKEINKFYKLLEAFEKIVALFPLLYPVSVKNQKIHRAVLSKQLSVFYTFNKNTIQVVAVLDNRMAYANWP